MTWVCLYIKLWGKKPRSSYFLFEAEPSASSSASYLLLSMSTKKLIVLPQNRDFDCGFHKEKKIGTKVPTNWIKKQIPLNL